MRALGHGLLWLGFLSAAFWSVSRLEQADDKWSTIPWGWYVLSMLVGVVGIVLLRTVRQMDHADEAKTGAEYSVIQQSLASLSATVGMMSEQSEYIPGQVVRRIDDECAEPLSEFAEARQALVKRFGLTVYADVMTQFASAERYINRTWSAAVDGYVDEVAASLRRANQHLINAGALLAAAEKNSDPHAMQNTP